MTELVAVLWIVYLSDCLATTSPATWTFRGLRSGQLRPSHGADVELLNGRVCLVWLPLLPWAIAFQPCGDSLDLRAARKASQRVLTSIRALQVSATVLFMLALPVPSVLALTDRLTPLFWPWVALAILAWTSTVWLFVAARRRLGVPTSAQSWWVAVLSPLSAIRTPMLLTTHSLREFHPVCVAAVACSDADFLSVGRLWHFDDVSLRDSIAELARHRGVLVKLRTPPDTLDSDLTQYCPRCHETYRDAASQCTACLVPLVRGRDFGAGV